LPKNIEKIQVNILKNNSIKRFYPANVRKKRMRKYILHGLILFAVFSLVKVWQNVSVDQVVRKNQILKRDLRQLQYKSSLLTLKFEALSNIERIEKLATEKLGFKQAKKINIELNPLDE